MINKGIIKNITGLGVAALLMTSCNFDNTTPNYTFMDDMYNSPSEETYAVSDVLEGGVEAQLPVEGTIARGFMPYEYENSPEGYMDAMANLKMPAEYHSEEAMADGKDLYVKFCSHCHGTKGDGNGILVEREKFLGIPGYDKTRLPDITPGSMYHVIMHGRNFMGSHASQLLEEERWQIISYVWYELRGEEMMSEEMTSDETEEMEETATEEMDSSEESETRNGNRIIQSGKDV